MSHSSRVPSSNIRPVTWPLPSTALVRRERCVVDAEAIHRREQHRPRRVVELHLHQVAHQVDDVDLDVELQETARGLEAEQAAADHRGAAGRGGVVADGRAVVQRPEDEDAAAVLPGVGDQPFERRHEGRAAGGDHQLVVRLDAPVVADHLAPVAIDRARRGRRRGGGCRAGRTTPAG